MTDSELTSPPHPLSASREGERLTEGKVGLTIAAVRETLRRNIVLLAILFVAVVMRVGYMPLYGHSDVQFFVDWSTAIHNDGLLRFYSDPVLGANRSYPALAIDTYGVSAAIYGMLNPGWTVNSLSDPALIAIVKISPVLAELLLIVAVYAWLRDRRVLRWLIPGALAVYPGLITTSAFWGQNDAVFTVFVVLTMLALNKDRPVLAWLMFALALSSKQQALALTPLMVVVTFRRYHLRGLLTGGILAALVMIAIVTPFILGSGLQPALAPYFKASDPSANPKITEGAVNSWYLVSPPTDGALFDNLPADNQAVLGPIEYKHIGLALLGLYSLIIVAEMWFHAHQKREFVWSAALFIGLFMLPTEIHERYLYAGAVLTLIAVAQDRRLWVPALILAYTYSYNIAKLAEPFSWLGIPSALLFPVSVAMQVALLNILAMLSVLAVMLTPTESAAFKSQMGRWSLNALRVVGAIIAVWGVGGLIVADHNNFGLAQWLAAKVPAYALVTSNHPIDDVLSLTNASPVGKTWFAYTLPTGTPAGLPWVNNTASYAVLTAPTNNALSEEIKTSQTGDALYHADIWPQGTQVVLLKNAVTPLPSINFEPVTFDDSLTLGACYAVKDADGTLHLYFRWFVTHTPSSDYHIFVHLVDPKSDALLGQADNWLGKGLYPTFTWHQDFTVIDEIDLPPDLLAKGQSPYSVRIGLYTLNGTTRAVARQGNQPPTDNLLMQIVDK